MIGESLLLLVAIAYSAAVMAIGRRLPRPASVTAYGTALMILVAVPLLPDPIAQRMDSVFQMVGAGRLLVHLGFMMVLCGIFLSIALATNRWTGRQHVALGGAGILTMLFVILWWYVRTLPLPDLAERFYGIRAGRPTPLLWMNVVMGGGIVYIAACGLLEFQYFMRAAHSTYERGVAGIVSVLYVLACVAGSLTIVEAVGRYAGRDMTALHKVKTPFTASVLTLSAFSLIGQIWLLPLWRHRRQLLLRYLEPELVQLRNDLLNLSAAEAERSLDMHQEAYAHRTMVEDVATRCREAGIPAARTAMARMATTLITLHRDNVLQDPGYGLVTSWDELREEAATEIDEAMAATAWEQALRDSYVSQQVYILMFLVLESRDYQAVLLIHERPPIQPWHQHLADLIATTMHAHGQITPRYVTLARHDARSQRLAWLRARLPAPWSTLEQSRTAPDKAGEEGHDPSTT